MSLHFSKRDTSCDHGFLMIDNFKRFSDVIHHQLHTETLTCTIMNCNNYTAGSPSQEYDLS